MRGGRRTGVGGGYSISMHTVLLSMSFGRPKSSDGVVGGRGGGRRPGSVRCITHCAPC